MVCTMYRSREIIHSHSLHKKKPHNEALDLDRYTYFFVKTEIQFQISLVLLLMALGKAAIKNLVCYCKSNK